MIRDDSELVEMTEQEYDSEALLQEMLAKYANLLAGDQIDSAKPRRWLLVAREVGVPSEEQGGERWAIDHLFLDQDGIPTFVEVKRSRDTRIRREVVGQMLDYAANAVVYWPVEEIRTKLEANLEAQGRDPEEVLVDFLENQTSGEEFWQAVKTNLQAGKVRMLFVADEIPPELRRVVEFLNRQMDPAQVLAVEIKQYVGQGQRSLVPRVIGQAPESKPRSHPERLWDEPSFLRELETYDGELVRPARAILDWSRACMPSISWGKGTQYGTFTPVLEYKGTAHRLISVWTNGYVQLQFGYMQSRSPFDDEAKRVELLRRLNAIDGITIEDDAITKYPSIALSILKNETAMKQFLETLDWVVQEIRAS